MTDGNAAQKSIARLWPLFVEQATKILDAEQERLSEEGHLMDSDECIQVLREASSQFSQTGDAACALAPSEIPECGCCGRTDQCDDDCDA